MNQDFVISTIVAFGASINDEPFGQSSTTKKAKDLGQGEGAFLGKSAKLIPKQNFEGEVILIPKMWGYFTTLWNTALLFYKGGELAPYLICQLPPTTNKSIVEISTLFRNVIVVTRPEYIKTRLAPY